MAAMTASCKIAACAALLAGCVAVPAAAAAAAAAGPTLKVFVLAGQSNMEGQAEVSKVVNGSEVNGTLTYQLTDPRTAKEFAQCWDKAKNNWTVLPDVKIWFNENGKGLPGPDPEQCPMGCPTQLGEGTFGDLSIGFGVMGSRAHIGPEYGFGFAIDAALEEPVLIIKTAWGGKTLCGDFRPPSSCTAGNTSVGFYYTQMLHYVSSILAPASLAKLFPTLNQTSYEIVGFGWDQGWNDGCGTQCTDEYETNMVNLINDLRKAWKNPEMAVSIPVSGFDGWGQKNARRLGVIDAQFGACNATRHPGMAHCVAEETRGFWRDFAYSPVNQGYHWWHNAESYWLIGQAMGTGMLKAMQA